jgi:hypothetical protein
MDPADGKVGYDVGSNLNVKRVDDEQSVEIICPEVAFGPLEMLLSQHHELDAAGTDGNGIFVGHHFKVVSECSPELAARDVPIVLGFRLDDHSRPDLRPVGQLERG